MRSENSTDSIRRETSQRESHSRPLTEAEIDLVRRGGRHRRASWWFVASALAMVVGTVAFLVLAPSSGAPAGSGSSRAFGVLCGMSMLGMLAFLHRQIVVDPAERGEVLLRRLGPSPSAWAGSVSVVRDEDARRVVFDLMGGDGPWLGVATSGPTWRDRRSPAPVWIVGQPSSGLVALVFPHGGMAIVKCRRAPEPRS